jgi:hypothetical protein
MERYTGARSNVISRETIQKLNLLHQIVPTDIRLSTANNSSQDQVDSINSCAHFDSEGTMQPDHQKQKEVKYQPGQFLIDFIVVEELSVP